VVHVSPLLWLVAGVALLLVEIFTLTAFVGMVGVGALAAAGVAALGAPTAVQIGTFAGTSLVLMVFAREPVQKVLSRAVTSDSADARALTGSTAVVTQQISDTSGQVRLNGELWRARPYAGTGPVDVGLPVHVAAVEGATLLVYSPDLG
jgi:membrane protein implicated in regulation of membrane protease activity